MQEEVENRTINVVIATTRLSARKLEDGLHKYLNGRAQKKYAKRNVKVQAKQRQKEQKKAEGPHGKQTMKQLVRHSNGLKEIPVQGEHMKDFEKILKKYGVDFAIMKEKLDPSRFLVFFKARDEAVLTNVLKECTDRQLSKAGIKRPSVLAALKKAKELIKAIPAKTRQKEKDLSR